MSKFLKKMICTILAVSFMGSASYAGTFVVGAGGSPKFASLTDAFATIGAFAGTHTILVEAGSYSDLSLVVPANIDSVIGAGSGVVTFTGDGSSNFITTSAAPAGFKLSGMSINDYNAGVVDGTGSGRSFTDLKVSSSNYGFFLSGTASGASILGFTSMANGIGVYLADAGSNSITNMTDSGNTTAAVYIDGSSAGNIIDNLIVTAGSGVRALGSSSGTMLDGMTVNGGTFGIYVGGTSTGNTFTNVTADGNANGAFLDGVSGNSITNSCFANSSVIDASSSAGGNTWSGNFYSDNGVGQPYPIPGGGGDSDATAKAADNSASGPALVNVDDEFSVDVVLTVPACDALSPFSMAAYNFAVTFDPTKLVYVGGSGTYDPDNNSIGYVGDLNGSTGAIYAPVLDSGSIGKIYFGAANFLNPGSGTGVTGSLKFQAIATGATVVTVASEYLDASNNPIAVLSTPYALTVQDVEAPVLVSYLQSDPAGDDTYSAGSVAGPGPFLELATKISATDNYALAVVEYSLDNGAFTPWYAISGTSFTDPSFVATGDEGLSEGAHSLDLRVKDASGNVSNVIEYDFVMDRTAPVLSSLLLLDDDSCATSVNSTNNANVEAWITASGSPFFMELVNGAPGALTGTQSPFMAMSVFALSGGAGGKTVSAQVWDKYNNRSASVSDAITLDLTAPVPTGWVLAGGLSKTNTPVITGASTAYGSGAVQLNYSENAANLVCGDAGWQSLSNPVNITLSSGDGLKTVYYATRDAAGNISAILSDQIELDQTAPTATAVASDVSDGGTDCTNSLTVNMTVTFADADVVWIGFQNDGGAFTWYGDGVTPIASPFVGAHTLTGPPADPSDVTVDVQLWDNATAVNIGTTSDEIHYDATAPTATSLVVKDKNATDAPTDPNYSNQSGVNLIVNGLSADVIAIIVSEDAFVTADTLPLGGPVNNPDTLMYTYQGAITECSNTNIRVMALDCAGNASLVEQDNIRFDFTLPVISAFTGPVSSNTPSVVFALTASDNCSLYQMRLTQDAPPSGDSGWVVFAVAPAFTLTGADGNKTVYVEVADRAGNISAVSSFSVLLDATAPVGAADLDYTGVTPYVYAEDYTNSLTDAALTSITYSGDAVQMWIQNLDGSNATGWIPVAPSYGPWTLQAGADGLRTVNIWFRDASLNQGGPFAATINYDATAPAAPVSVTAVPGGSVDLSWTAAAGARGYLIRYNFSGGYPDYNVLNPPAPTLVTGFAVPAYPLFGAISYEFDAPQPDIYHFSIWSVDSAGNVSASANTDGLSTDYILGDFAPIGNPDGCIDFVDEFSVLASAYGTVAPNVNYSSYVDFGHPLGPNNTPDPDGDVDFDDLVTFALNYADYACTPSAPRGAFEALAANIALKAEIPNYLIAGRQFTMPITAENFGGILGCHLVMEFDASAVEVISIDAGSAFSSLPRSFFHVERSASTMEISGIILGNETFESDELAVVTFRVLRDGPMTINTKELDVRDRRGIRTEVAFNVTAGSSPEMLPSDFSLMQNFPNPFNPKTTIRLALPTASDYSVTIYNIAGQIVEEMNGFSEAGFVTVDWDASRHASGVYLYSAKASGFRETKSMVLLK